MIPFDKDSLEYKLIHLVEECSEVQKEVAKAFRYGLNSQHDKYGPETTRMRLFLELQDVKQTIEDLEYDMRFTVGLFD